MRFNDFNFLTAQLIDQRLSNVSNDLSLTRACTKTGFLEAQIELNRYNVYLNVQRFN